MKTIELKMVGIAFLGLSTTAQGQEESSKPQDASSLELRDQDRATTSVEEGRGVQVWLGLSGGLGVLDYIHDNNHPGATGPELRGKFTGMIYGGSFGIGGFVDSKVELGVELALAFHQAVAAIKGRDLGAAANYGFSTLPLGLRVSFHPWGEKRLVISAALRGGLGKWDPGGDLVWVGAYSAEVGYPLFGGSGRGRTSILLGYERTGTSVPIVDAESDVSYVDHQVIVTLRMHLTR